MTAPVALAPVVRGGAPSWPGAVWVGAADAAPLAAAAAGPGLLLVEADGFTRARLLVRAGRTPRGFVEVPVVDGVVPAAALADALAGLPPAPLTTRPPVPREGSRPAVSVVVCTRDRPEQLRVALASLVALLDGDGGVPGLEVVVVDNASSTPLTRDVVAALGHPRVRLVEAPVPGLSRARNVGLLAARHDVVAFTDDDVVVDPGWPAALADAFARNGSGGTASDGAQVACVCGLVPSAELRSPAQAWFDRRVSWARSTTPRVFSLAAGRHGDPLFPFRVGHYGTGANFAVRRSAVLALGGFDEALGIGSPTGGGEDIDLFVRVLLSGRALAYEPAAVVWHRHRTDVADLRRQVRDYGTGLGGWLTTLALRPRTALMLARRAVPGVRHAVRMTRVALPDDGAAACDAAGRPEQAALAALGRVERSAVAAGVVALLAARRAGARRRPLAGAAARTPSSPSNPSGPSATVGARPPAVPVPPAPVEVPR